jgi:tRNA (guanine37-N1)-methyltransferase
MNLYLKLEEKIPKEDLKKIKRTFEVIGDICILEIEEELEKYQKIIGKTILEINKNVKTIVKKNGTYKEEFRIRNFEFICGEKKFETIHKENGIKLKVDINKVYFSSKMSHNREIIFNEKEKDKSILILFSGLGPYTLNY